MNCFNTVLMLRMNEPSMMERASKRLGKLEMETVSQNQALAVNEFRDGAGVNIQDHEKWLVMPSEIGALESCTGFLKLVGGYPAAKVDYRHWLPSKRGRSAYVDRFAARQESPDRDPSFYIERSWVAGSVDPLAMVTESLKKPKAEGTKPDADSSEIRDQGDPAKSLDDQRELTDAGEKEATLRSLSKELVDPASVMLSGLMERS
jgi:hypothetical protein